MTKNPRLIPMSGKRFGKWLVGDQAGNAPRGGALWYCTCDCGTQRVVLGADLRSAKSASCGCTVDRELLGNLKRTHGGTRTRLYYAWQNMRKRCGDPQNSKYRYYGGRGISISREWDGFAAFQDWAISNGYSDTLTLERVDVNGNYTPANCTWITKRAQAANKTNNHKAPDGTLWLHKARENGIKDDAFRRRVFDGWPHEEAANIPMNVRRVARERDASGKYA